MEKLDLLSGRPILQLPFNGLRWMLIHVAEQSRNGISTLCNLLQAVLLLGEQFTGWGKPMSARQQDKSVIGSRLELPQLRTTSQQGSISSQFSHTLFRSSRPLERQCFPTCLMLCHISLRVVGLMFLVRSVIPFQLPRLLLVL